MDKKKDLINLRIDLEETQVSDNLRSWQPQNFTELINKPKKTFFRHSYSRNDTFTSNIDYDKFVDLDLLPNDDSPRSNKSIQSVGDLIKQNYSSYIGNIKNMYPNFKFNHYSKYSETIKKINPLLNLNSSDFRGSELSATTKNSSLVDYQSSTKLVSIGLGEEYILPKDNFRIGKEILEENIEDLYNTEKRFDNKVEGIEMELDRILKNSSLIYNYIEENTSLGTEIDRSIKGINGKRNLNRDLNKEYIINSSKLMLMGLKKQNIIKVLNQMKLLHNLSRVMDNLLSLSKKDSECNEMSEGLSISKSLLNEIKSIEKMKKVKFVILYEKELMTFGNKSEQKLYEDFTNLITKLFLISLSTMSASSSVSSTVTSLTNQNGSSPRKLPPYNLSPSMQNAEVITDYSFENRINILLISKTQSCKVLLYQLLDVLNIIIKDNMDISDFIELMEKIIKKIVMILFENIQKLYSSQPMKLIEALSNCFKITYFNYDYIINLFNINYGLSNKVFNDLNKNILNEMTKLLSFVISSFLQDQILSIDSIEFTSIKENITRASQHFYDLAEMDVDIQFRSFNNEFLLKYFENQSLILNEAFNVEEWSQLPKINGYYQEIANTLLSGDSMLDKHKIMNTYTIKDNSNEHEYLFLKESKYRLISLSLAEVKFLNECLELFLSFNQEYHYDILIKCSSIIEDIGLKSRDLIIEGKDSIKEKKFTEKETALLCANINIIRQLFTSTFSFMSSNNDKAKIELDRLNNILIEISSVCKGAMIQLLNELIYLMINDLNSLDFANYPFYPGKDYNSYVKKFVRMIKLYETMLYSFDNNDIIMIFDDQLKHCFEQMEKVVNSKCKIEADNSLKQ